MSDSNFLSTLTGLRPNQSNNVLFSTYSISLTTLTKLKLSLSSILYFGLKERLISENTHKFPNSVDFGWALWSCSAVICLRWSLVASLPYFFVCHWEYDSSSTILRLPSLLEWGDKPIRLLPGVLKRATVVQNLKKLAGDKVSSALLLFRRMFPES